MTVCTFTTNLSHSAILAYALFCRVQLQVEVQEVQPCSRVASRRTGPNNAAHSLHSLCVPLNKGFVLFLKENASPPVAHVLLAHSTVVSEYLIVRCPLTLLFNVG